MAMGAIGCNNYLASLTLMLLFVCTKIVEAKLPDTVQCVDPKCEVPISSGLTTQLYMSREKGILTFKQDAEAIIYSKEDNSKSALWGVKINDRKGFIPNRFVKEQKVYVKDDKLIKISTHLNDRVEKTTNSVGTSDASGNSVGTSDASANLDAEQPQTPEDSGSSEKLDAFEHTHISRDSDQLQSPEDESAKQSETLKDGGDTEVTEASNPDGGNGEDTSSKAQDEIENQRDYISSEHSENNEKVAEQEDVDEPFQPQSEQTEKERNLESRSIPHNLNPDSTSKSYEVVDGTTLYTNPTPASEQEFPNDFLINSESSPNPATLQTSQIFEEATYKHTDPLPSHSVPIEGPQGDMGELEGDTPLSSDKKDRDINEVEESSTFTHNPEVGNNDYADNQDLKINQIISDKEISSSEHDANDKEVAEEGANNDQESATENSIETTQNESDIILSQDNSNVAESSASPSQSPTEQEEEFSSPKPDSLIVKPPMADSSSDLPEATTEKSQPVYDLFLENSSESVDFLVEDDDVGVSKHLNEIPANNNSGPFESFENNQAEFDDKTSTFSFIDDSNAKYDSISHMENGTPEPFKVEESSYASDESSENLELPKDDLPFTDPDLGSSDSPKFENQEATEQADPKEEEENSPFSSMAENVLDATSPFLSDGMSLAIENVLVNPQLSSGSLVLLLIVAGTIVAIYFTNLIVKKMSQEAPLLEAMNNLARKFRLSHEENHTLKKQLTNSNGQIKTHLSIESSGKIVELQSELDGTKALREKESEELTERIHQLEQDLEDAEMNASELHQMLNELVSEKKEATNFQASLDQVQAMLDAQKEKVENLNSDLLLKKRLNEELQIELRTSRERAVKHEHQIEQLTYSLEELNTTKQETLKNFEKEQSHSTLVQKENLTLQEDLHEVEKEMKHMLSQVRQLREAENGLRRALSAKEAELKVLKECLKKLSTKDGFKKMGDVLNSVEIKSHLAATQKEKSTLLDQLKEASSEHDSYEKTISKLKKDLNDAISEIKVLTHDKVEIKTKLDVLTNYFKEKECELTKELESKEGLRLEAEGSASVISNRIHNYESELSTLRSQMETLKSELEDQNQSYKMLLINEEQKTQENWLSFRGAKRRQEELLQENSQLRQRLSSLQQEKTDSQNALLKPMLKRMEANGSMSSPVSTEGDLDRHHPSLHTLPLDMDGHLPPLPHMLPPMFPGGPPPPPLPHGLHHPPPPPFLGGLPMPLPDRRLPPAGRMASPPFRRHRSPPGRYDRRSYSPSSDHSQYSDQYSPTMRYSPGGSGEVQRQHSPDRRSERSRPYNSRSSRGEDSPPPPGMDRHPSPDRWYNRSPDGARHFKNYHDDISDFSNRRVSDRTGKGTKTSTPLGPNDR